MAITTKPNKSFLAGLNWLAVALCASGLVLGIIAVVSMLGVAAGEALGPPDLRSLLFLVPAVIATVAFMLALFGYRAANKSTWEIRQAMLFLTVVPTGLTFIFLTTTGLFVAHKQYTLRDHVSPFPLKEVSGKTFTIQIPTHWSAHKTALSVESEDSLIITDAHAIPVDKYFKPGEWPGTKISMRLLGPFTGTFPPPEGASGEGAALSKFNGGQAREWIHPSPSRHELGVIRTVLIASGGRLYRLDCGPADNQEKQKIVNRIIWSIRPK